MDTQRGHNDQFLKFRTALKEVFSGPNGKLVMDFLEQTYVDTPVINESVQITCYRLGQKELIQGLLKDANTDLEALENAIRGEV